MKTKQHSPNDNISAFNYETVVMGKRVGADEAYATMINRDVRLTRLSETVPVQTGKILDIGCGGGTISNCLSHMYPKAVISGCDVSGSAIALAKENALPRTSFGVIKNGVFPYKDNTFDMCICFDVLEHVPDVERFMSETRRVTKPGGKVFFAIPCEGQFLSLTWFLNKMRIGHTLTYKHVGHIHPEFTHAYIRKVFAKNKFDVISVSYSEHFITQCVRFIRFILPKEALELIFGSKHAEKYYDRAIVTKERQHEAKKGMLSTVRNAWLAFGVVFDAIERTEASLLRHWPVAAWKILVYAQKTK